MTAAPPADTAPEGNLGGRSRFQGLVYDFAGERTPEQAAADVAARLASPHPRKTRHQRMLETYRDARWAWENERNKVTYDYAEENRDYQAEHPSPVLRDFMRDFS